MRACPEAVFGRPIGDETTSSAKDDRQFRELIRSVVLEVLNAVPVTPRTSDHDRPDWITTFQAANFLMICPTSLEKARSTGRGPLASIPYHKIGRSVRYARADVVAAVARLRVPGRTTQA